MAQLVKKLTWQIGAEGYLYPVKYINSKKSMKTTFTRSAVLAAGILATSSALAAPVFIKETGLGNGMATGGLLLPINSSPLNYWSGLQTLLINNSDKALAFCVDPWEWSSSANQTYSTNSLDAIFGTAKSGFINELYSESYASTLMTGTTGNLNAAAFQLALWEIITDDNPNAAGLQSNFSNGLVQKTGSTNMSIVQAATSMLGLIDGVNGSDTYSFDLYTSGKSLGQGRASGYQDFLVASKLEVITPLDASNNVPEPGAFSLMLGALGGMGLLALSRRQKPAKA